MKIPMYQVDAFADRVFEGNPAAVCVLEKWLKDKQMQMIAAENNLAETAFIVPNGAKYEIRWFTPTVEVLLCGHATLAAAHVLFKYYGALDKINFHSHLSGDLFVENQKKLLVLDFPVDELNPTEAPMHLFEALGKDAVEVYKGKSDYLLIYPSQDDIESMNPDFSLLSKVEMRGVIVSARGKDVDFVSRFFGPQVGINEDPVTGSAHTSLIPYWSGRLEKQKLVARQLSRRGGTLYCEYKSSRVLIAGNAVTYFKGKIKI
jgi:PhzF family phenazine biosynthesis protein